MFESRRIGLARALIGRYPRAWRDRYADELLALIEDAPPRWRDLLDLWRGSLTERTRSLIEPAAYPRLSVAAVILARWVLLPAAIVGVAFALGLTLSATAGRLDETAFELATEALFVLFLGTAIGYLARGLKGALAGSPRWSLGLPGRLIFLSTWTGLIVLQTWADQLRGGYQIWSWVFSAAWTSNLVLNRLPIRTVHELKDTVEKLMLSREQLSWARMELTRCETLSAQGASNAAELARAQTELSRWQTLQDEAMGTLRQMGYRARFQ